MIPVYLPLLYWILISVDVEVFVHTVLYMGGRIGPTSFGTTPYGISVTVTKKHGVIIEEIDYSRIRRYGNIEDLNRQDDLAFKFYTL